MCVYVCVCVGERPKMNNNKKNGTQAKEMMIVEIRRLSERETHALSLSLSLSLSLHTYLSMCVLTDCMCASVASATKRTIDPKS